jgi:hypothetical protein
MVKFMVLERASWTCEPLISLHEVRRSDFGPQLSPPQLSSQTISKP